MHAAECLGLVYLSSSPSRKLNGRRAPQAPPARDPLGTVTCATMVLHDVQQHEQVEQGDVAGDRVDGSDHVLARLCVKTVAAPTSILGAR